MATIAFKGIAEYQKKLEELGKRDADKAIRYAIYPAAGMVRDEIKRAAPVDTGDLENSVALTKMTEEDGFIYTKVVFAGYDSKGVPNQLKARALESGRSSPGGKVGKRPFVRKAVNRARKKAEGLMQAALDHYLYEYFRK